MDEFFAQVILDITHANLDHTFSYKIPETLLSKIGIGSAVIVPFGKANREIKAYVIGISTTPGYDRAKVKTIIAEDMTAFDAQRQLVELAVWIKNQYGSTMIQALKTVMPVTKTVTSIKKKTVTSLLSREDLLSLLKECQQKKNQKARVRLLEALLEDGEIPYDIACHKLHLTSALLKPMKDKGWIVIKEEEVYRNPVKLVNNGEYAYLHLNPWQQQVYDELEYAYEKKDLRPCLLHGITGSGKTEIYMELIDHAISYGRQAIVLIPEIALTYQTVMRFYRRFNQKVSFINSRLSKGERYDQFRRAKDGEIDIMIGPRSALFTPFANLGLIIIDEEHEGAYKSETTPRYHAREVALERARQNNALVVLGSATPSVDSYHRACRGEYHLLTLTHRAKKESVLPSTEVVDMRKEMMSGNKTMFSRYLYEKINERLDKKEQIILFLNRRGYSNFISCRSCGEAVKCPHCDVSLTMHRDGSLHCHYCGFVSQALKKCPTCGSPYIAGFGTGTQKVEEQLIKLFPKAKVLRMDMDTTQGKDGHEKIIRSFANAEADILLGTQMVVKGHDFEKVTLVGAMAADMSLYSEDYRSTERTFQLLTQAAGRAGRDSFKGEMVIQTYKPEHYSIQTAAKQDYLAFYEEEIRYRKMMGYPPALAMVMIILSSEKEKCLDDFCEAVVDSLRRENEEKVMILGPTIPAIGRINDIYYKRIYLKHVKRDILTKKINQINQQLNKKQVDLGIFMQYDYL